MLRFFSLSIFAILLPTLLLAQAGTIAGKVIDGKTAETLIGVSVRLDDGGNGAVTDLDGFFRIANVPVGKHKVSVTYIGYQAKTIEEIEVKSGEASTADIVLSEETTGTALAEVVIVAKANRESQSALTILQKNSVVIADGISSETIKRTPDRTTGDVIKRISGASIQDGRFAVIRGLNDRYNVAMVNGALLSSTEPDRRAFSFDIFPSALLDNLLVFKTASPDLPGEFAGGAIVINTRDIPEKSYLSLSVGAGANFLTTFKDYQKADGGGTDWLGLDDGSRALPAAMPSTRPAYINLPVAEQQRIAQTFSNNWATTTATNNRPNLNFQINSGLLKKLNETSSLGATLALTYSNSLRFQTTERYDYDLGGQLIAFKDNQYNTSVLWGALANIGYTLNSNNKLVFQSTYTLNSDNGTFLREGAVFPDERYQKSQAIEFTQTGLLTTRLSGEHNFGDKKYKLNWGGGFNQLDRSSPDTRRVLYTRSLEDETAPFSIYVPPGGGDPYRMGRVYLDMTENIINGNVDFTIPFEIAGQKQSFKIGGLVQNKQRDFAGRLLGIIKSDNVVRPGLLQQPLETIFAPENFASDGFRLDDITANSDRYDAQSDLFAGFAMLQNTFGRFKLTYGVRFEGFNQKLNSYDQTNKPLNIDRTTNSVLPSLNVTYGLNDQQNLRFSASQTVSRPEFRELAPFSFFDFITQTQIIGNPSLKNAKITNLDVRYEVYPGSNQLFSVSLFYKKFDNPIEQVVASSGATSRTRSFNNVPSAINYGAEFEVRKNFGFISENLESVVGFANLALIKSKLDLSKTDSPNKDRPLQGQSPYVANVGLQAGIAKWGLNTTLVYNIVGDRIFEVGFFGYNDVYERHRNLLDFQLAKKIGKHGELKFNWQDILAQPFIYYQDNEISGKYEEKPTTNALTPNDYLIQKVKVASTISLSFNYRF